MEEEHEGYKWEVAYTEGLNIRNALQEDEAGLIEDSVRKIILEAKRQRRVVEKPSHIRLGIMRYVYIVLDASSCMLNQSLYPTRFQVAVSCLNKFLDKFFEQNPLSQIGVILCREKYAERLIGFTSSPQMIREALSNVNVANCSGEFSLDTALQVALQSFQGLPGHSSKEIVLIVASLVSIDAGNVFTTFEILKTRGIRCSVIGLSAEVYVYKKLCAMTSGKHNVLLDETHFEILLSDYVQPPIAAREQEASIVRMGFPKRCQVNVPSFCMCHELAGSGDSFLQEFGSVNIGNEVRAFYCPQCSARYCQTPVECRVCGLLLLTAPQLARAHQHLQPLSAFVEVQVEPNTKRFCFGCDQILPINQKCYACKKCDEYFCIDCDILLHESLQICPSCE